jgi:hypothetical protein
MDGSPLENQEEMIFTSSALEETIELPLLLSTQSLDPHPSCLDGHWVIGGPSTVSHSTCSCCSEIRKLMSADPYKQDEYLALMDKFNQEKIPLSVAVVDMDWHILDIPADQGAPWTGYT